MNPLSKRKPDSSQAAVISPATHLQAKLSYPNPSPSRLKESWNEADLKVIACPHLHNCQIDVDVIERFGVIAGRAKLTNSVLGFCAKLFPGCKGLYRAVCVDDLHTLCNIWFSTTAFSKWLKLQMNVGHVSVQCSLPSKWSSGANTSQNINNYDIQLTSNGMFRNPGNITHKFARELYNICQATGHTVTLLPPHFDVFLPPVSNSHSLCKEVTVECISCVKDTSIAIRFTI